MTSWADTIYAVLARLGQGASTALFEWLTVFEGLGLSDEERASVISSALAAAAVTHHDSHVPKLLTAIRLWSVELASLRPPRIDGVLRVERMLTGIDILALALDELIEELRDVDAGAEDRVVVELTFFARLLGRHDAATIALILATVEEVLGDENYQPGDLLTVPLRDPVFDHATNLDEVLARGNA
jgi:hypothetical protein